MSKRINKALALALCAILAVNSGSIAVLAADENREGVPRTVNVEQTAQITPTGQEEQTVQVEQEAQAVQTGQEEQTAQTVQEEVAQTEPQNGNGAVRAASSVSYRTHVQDFGWQNYVRDSAVSGTDGQAKRLEAIQIKLENPQYGGGIQYQTHIENIGWENVWKSDDALSGTTGQAKRLEAIRVRLTGEMANYFDVYYRVHVQDFGWLGWAKNGESSGTSGYAKRMEAIEIRLVSKGNQAPGSTSNAFLYPLVSYKTHVQNIGWQEQAADGMTAGTTGRTLRLEAFQVSVDNEKYSGGIQYSAHVQNIGWQGWVQNGQTAGTSGQQLRVEAMRVQLTGEMAEHYDVYYRTHVQNFGWLGWAKNGEISGTTGWFYAVEAMEVRLVEKGGAAPGSTANPYIPPIWEITAAQAGESTAILVKPDSLNEIVNSGKATSVEVTAELRYNGNVTRQVKKEVSLRDIPSEGIRLNVGDYGKFYVTVQFKNNGYIVGNTTQIVGVTASEYNIAPLSATFPVVYFSLALWDINQGDTVPTIVMLDRPSAYNWNNLPQGVYGMPYLSKSAIAVTSDYNAFAQYVKDLYEMNPKSKFNLYLNDITCSYIHQVIYANRIPEGQYSITMLSDGSGTYGIMNETYNVADPEAKDAELVAAWNRAKEEAYATGRVSAGWGWHQHWDSMYAVTECEPGTEWWVGRDNLFTSGDGNQFAENRLKPAVTKKNVNSMLQELQAKGDNTVAAFKKLYNFNDGYFTEAENQGKEAMVLMGTYVNLEENFGDYAHLTQLYYGDDYLYYYKGHPNTPTGLWPVKQAELEQLGITDVDSSIAAELILFFNPEIKISGYGTSTFNSASKEMACGLFNSTKADAFAGGGVDYSGIDWFAFPINSKMTDVKGSTLCTEGDTSYKLEFSDEILAQGKYDFAIYNATKGVLTFYKETKDGTFEMVDRKSDEKKITYEAHVSDLGWLASASDGKTAGTVGKSKAMEALKVQLGNTGYDGGVSYQAHVANIGWQNPVEGGKIAGTVGQSKAMEAVSIRLTGEVAQHYDIYYRVHAQDFGWMGWAKNGEYAGTAGYAKRLEAIEIKLVAKGEAAPGSTAGAYFER